MHTDDVLNYRPCIEFILMSDILGISTLVDSVNNAKPANATESTVLGPFYTLDAHERMYMHCHSLQWTPF